jgi:hypothetical protein
MTSVKRVLALPLPTQKLYKLSATTINWLRDELDELGEGDSMESPSTRGADVPLGDWG